MNTTASRTRRLIGLAGAATLAATLTGTLGARPGRRRHASLPGSRDRLAVVRQRQRRPGLRAVQHDSLNHMYYPGHSFSAAGGSAYHEEVVFIQLALKDLGYRGV